jgi:tetratricopeptide (TPR) repeat protein
MRLFPIAPFLLPLAAAFAQTPAPPADSLDLGKSAVQSFEQGDYPAAEKAYKMMLTTHPDDFRTLDNLALVDFKDGKPVAAKAALEKAVSIAPHDGTTYYDLGMILSGGMGYDAALAELTKALAIEPQNPIIQKAIVAIEQLKRSVRDRFGDFDTPHERQALLDEGQIGLPPTDFN